MFFFFSSTNFKLDKLIKLSIETKGQSLCSLTVPRDALLLVKNGQKIYPNQVIAEIKKDASLVLEEDRKDIYTEVSGEAFLTKPNSTTFMIQDIIKKITKIKPKLSTTGGTSDARFIRKIAPCLEFGLVGKTMHKVDEAVSLTDLKKLSLIYSKILKNYFK